VLNGAKTFISNGIMADWVIVVARTDPDAGSRGLSLFLVETGMAGFSRGRQLEKIGLHAQDTAELVFEDVHLTAANLLGEEGAGFRYLMERLPRERLSAAVSGICAARAALRWTVEYTTQRHVFGKPVSDLQNTQFVLAEVDTDIRVGEAFVDSCIRRLNAGQLTAADAARAKLWATEMQVRSVDRCLQLFGGYGYMTEYPIARSYLDSRIQTIYGGSSEIMKVIISRDLFPGRTPSA
jgi:long-chain-acyl-CoA dehydrogenase